MNANQESLEEVLPEVARREPLALSMSETLFEKLLTRNAQGLVLETLEALSSQEPRDNPSIEKCFTCLASCIVANKKCVTGESEGDPHYWSSIEYWINEGLRIALKNKAKIEVK